MGLFHWLHGHVRKGFLLLVNFLFNYEFVLAFVGRLGIFSSVFVAYPASEDMALAYVYPQHRGRMAWTPWPAGIFRQNGKWGLLMVISSTEESFNKENKSNLELLLRNTCHVQRLLRAEQHTFAGVLPSIFAQLGFRRDTVEADVTVASVLRAEALLNPGEDAVVVLGGKGFLGRRIVEALQGKRRKVIVVDIDDTWPSHLQGTRLLVINTSRKSVLRDYLESFWSGVTLLNEVYPAPSAYERDRLRELGIDLFHVVGLQAFSFPSFPREYSGGIPCCAGWNCSDLNVLVRLIN